MDFINWAKLAYDQTLQRLFQSSRNMRLRGSAMYAIRPSVLDDRPFTGLGKLVLCVGLLCKMSINGAG